MSDNSNEVKTFLILTDKLFVDVLNRLIYAQNRLTGYFHLYCRLKLRQSYNLKLRCVVFLQLTREGQTFKAAFCKKSFS